MTARMACTYERTMAAPMSPHSSQGKCWNINPRTRLRRDLDSSFPIAEGSASESKGGREGGGFKIKVKVNTKV